MNIPAGIRHLVFSFIAHPVFRWIILTLISVAIIVTAALSYRSIHNELTTITLVRREAIAQLTAALLTEKFGRLTDVGISLATRQRVSDLVAEGKWDEAGEYLRTVPKHLPMIERLFLADAGGTLRVDIPALPGVRGKNFSHREWYQGVSRRWQTTISPVYLRTAAPQTMVVAVAVPMRNAQDRVTGILVLQVTIEALFNWVRDVDTGPGGQISIIDSKGQTAFRSGHKQQQITDVSQTPLVNRLRHGEHGVEITYTQDGDEAAIVAFAGLSAYGWGVIVEQPSDQSIGLIARDDQLERLLTGYALLLLLSLAAMILVSRIAAARRQAQEAQQMRALLEQRVQERTAQLEAANRELEAFSYSVSHDLRAPLRAIDGFSQALLEDYDGRLDAQGKHFLERVRAATQRMGELIDDMLTLSRVTRSEMKHETVDLSALAAEIQTDLARSDPARHVDWHIQPGLTATGDARLLRIALLNLLGNAWKFSSKNDKARIEFGATTAEGDAPACFVRDNGAGFDMTYADKLFGAFQRLHTPSEFPGTGIGLATVQRIIHRHGGHLWAKGETGRGATFSFTLPS